MKTQFTLLINFINNPGFIVRVALVLERRGFAVQSLKVNERRLGVSTMELIICGSLSKKEQVFKQLEKLIDVKSVKELEAVNTSEVLPEKIFLHSKDLD